MCVYEQVMSSLLKVYKQLSPVFLVYSSIQQQMHLVFSNMF